VRSPAAREATLSRLPPLLSPDDTPPPLLALAEALLDAGLLLTRSLPLLWPLETPNDEPDDLPEDFDVDDELPELVLLELLVFDEEDDALDVLELEDFELLSVLLDELVLAGERSALLPEPVSIAMVVMPLCPDRSYGTTLSVSPSIYAVPGFSVAISATVGIS